MHCNRITIPAALIAVFYLAGCGGSAGPLDWPTDPQAMSQRYHAAMGGEAGEHAGSMHPSLDAALPEQADTQTYVDLAMAYNPSIRAAQIRILRLSERVAQAGALDDPMFMIGAGDLAQTAAGHSQFSTGISQKLPLPDKLKTRERIAEQDVQAARADLAQTRLQVAAEVRRTYWSYYFLSQAIGITADSQKVLKSLQEVTETRLRVNQAAQQDVIKVSTEIGILQSKLLTYQQQRDTATAQLNQLLGRDTFSPLPDPLPIKPNDLTWHNEQLQAIARQHNPEIQKVRARLNQFRQKLKLARLQDWPDLTVGYNYVAVEDGGLAGSANGDDQWWVSVGVNLPIWREPREAARRESLHGIGENLQALTDTQNRVAFGVQDALLRMESQRQLIKLFGEQIIPQARDTLDISITQYATGKTEFVTVIDNWRTLLNYQLMHEQNLSQFERSVADLLQSIGKDITSEQPQASEVAS